MRIMQVRQFFESNGFSETQFKRKMQNIEGEEYSILRFDCVLINKERSEIYILEEKLNCMFTRTEIEKLENMIAAFIPFLRNSDPIKYNINLMLLCPLHIKQSNNTSKEKTASIIGVERSKQTCRKIFLDTSSDNFDDELSMIPSFPLRVDFKFAESEQSNLSFKIKEVLSDELTKELSKENSKVDLDKITSLLRGIQDEK
ncbi:ABC-three component system middle component 1 [Paenibacillus sp. FSL R7-0337]|uniref:ABC-three component system middle component 1 n=1 Tax=Paenibacillus sp. FSL R7-0337 TaxID=1926588 RepID=UPI00096F5ECF|nr:ABC-three component system middle component 1 [Paenibacillus sp. FSL R7-0337]OMF84315.1 hypothetical protein BK147_33395 [Paenibacillus sp. FSL R7-0337]